MRYTIYANVMARKWGRKTKYSMLSSGDSLWCLGSGKENRTRKLQENVIATVAPYEQHWLIKKRKKGVHIKIIFYGF